MKVDGINIPKTNQWTVFHFKGQTMKPNVLLVDDDRFILSALIRSFRHEPFQVFTAHSAEEATEILKRTKVDVIVSDEAMRGMKGTELLTWVAEHFPEVPRIILTGQPSVPSMQSAINKAGVFRYLTKPIEHVELANIVNEALETGTGAVNSTEF